MDRHPLTRRQFLARVAGVAAALWLPALPAREATPLITRPIPASGERLPVIGMGSWLTFDVGSDAEALATRVEVLRTFFARGGRVVDSSPMYGRSEQTIGHCLKQIAAAPKLFSATKVWTWGRGAGIRQMESSRELWGVERFDLMQVHNLLDWESHLPTLREWKEAGRIRYLGVTTSHGRRHDELERLMTSEPLDFVQLTYNLLDREAEARLLPLAAERGIAVIVNRPFQGGRLFRALGRQPLPAWAAEYDCANWAQLFLKFVVSHPAVTVAIPATSKVAHMEENMGALRGRLPGAEGRRRMAALAAAL